MQVGNWVGVPLVFRCVPNDRHGEGWEVENSPTALLHGGGRRVHHSLNRVFIVVIMKLDDFEIAFSKGLSPYLETGLDRQFWNKYE